MQYIRFLNDSPLSLRSQESHAVAMHDSPIDTYLTTFSPYLVSTSLHACLGVFNVVRSRLSVLLEQFAGRLRAVTPSCSPAYSSVATVRPDSCLAQASSSLSFCTLKLVVGLISLKGVRRMPCLAQNWHRSSLPSPDTCEPDRTCISVHSPFL